MSDQPTTESMNVEEIQETISSISPDTPVEEMIKKVDFLIIQLNQAYDMNKRNVAVLMEALEQAQTRYKAYEKAKPPFKERVKLFIKKVLIGIGWYEASLEELKQIHFGR